MFRKLPGTDFIISVFVKILEGWRSILVAQRITLLCAIADPPGVGRVELFFTDHAVVILIVVGKRRPAHSRTLPAGRLCFRLCAHHGSAAHDNAEQTNTANLLQPVHSGSPDGIHGLRREWQKDARAARRGRVLHVAVALTAQHRPCWEHTPVFSLQSLIPPWKPDPPDSPPDRSVPLLGGSCQRKKPGQFTKPVHPLYTPQSPAGS